MQAVGFFRLAGDIQSDDEQMFGRYVQNTIMELSNHTVRHISYPKSSEADALRWTVGWSRASSRH